MSVGRVVCALAAAAALGAGVAACGSGDDRTAQPVTDTNPAVNVDPSGTIGGKDPETNLPVTQTETTQTTPADTSDSGGTEAPTETSTTPTSTVDASDAGGADAGGAGSGGADADSAATVPATPEPTGGSESP